MGPGRAGARAGRGRSVSEHGLAVPPGRLGPGTRRCSRGPGPDSRADGGDSALLSTTAFGLGLWHWAATVATAVRVRLSDGPLAPGIMMHRQHRPPAAALQPGSLPVGGLARGSGSESESLPVAGWPGAGRTASDSEPTRR